MDQPYLLQSAGWRDFFQLRKLEQECFGVDAWPAMDLLTVLVIPHFVRIKVVLNGQMVGFIGGETKKGTNVGWIVTVGISPAHRRQGLARQLLHACEQQLNVDWLRLSVRKSNLAAIQLYNSEGFVHIDTWSGYYRDGEDALILEKGCNTDF